MQTFVKPVVVISKCLEFAPCRYDGSMVSDEFVRGLKARVDFLPVCPEMEIGLGCPRDAIRVVSVGGELRLMQPTTGRDVTPEMRAFAAAFLGGLGTVDGFLLKSRSPSCGARDVKVFATADADEPCGSGIGFFAAAVLERFPDAAVEDESRLQNPSLCEHFLTRIFTMAEFRSGRRGG
jgi:uncharacterized protein YbbK (DUF523 family)